MDALKHIPDNVNYLKTEKGDARLQKTDIFKKIMWFSYPKDDNWVPVEIDRVKEIQKQNKDGVIPADLGEMKEPETKAAKVLDYENVVGQDSLTRLDERNRNKNKNNRNRNPNNPQQANRQGGQQQQQRPGNNNPNKPKGIPIDAPKPVDGIAATPNANPNKRRNKNRHKNRGNNNQNGSNNAPKAE